MRVNEKQERLFTAQELAEILHVSKSYAYELIRLGKIRHVQMGRLKRVRQCHIDEYLTQREKPVLTD